MQPLHARDKRIPSQSSREESPVAHGSSVLLGHMVMIDPVTGDIMPTQQLVHGGKRGTQATRTLDSRPPHLPRPLGGSCGPATRQRATSRSAAQAAAGVCAATGFAVTQPALLPVAVPAPA
jgi:hypothetical protein